MGKKSVFLLLLGFAVVALTSPAAFGLNIDIRITNGMDDVEEHISSRSMDVDSTDLELPYEDDGTPSATDEQHTGLRYSVPIPKGGRVLSAYLEFEQDETKGNTKPVNLIIEGQLVPNAPAFTTNAGDLSGRAPKTKAQVKWSPPMGGANNDKFRTPDIASIINEIIGQSGWASGNALVLIIRDDKDNPSTGIRCVEAVEGEPAAAALLHLEVFSPFASQPNPADGSIGAVQGLLSWRAGDGAIFHNVYFGTTPDLTEANQVAKNQPFAMYFHVPGFTPGTTYYWRVDEVDATGAVSTGPVWSFSTPSQKAYAPIPKNGGRYAPLDVTLSWTAGAGAYLHTVYFGTTFDQVNNASGGTAQSTTTYTPAGPLAKGTTYYWRVDESDGKETHKGDVWSFTTMPDIKITDPDLVGWWMFEESSGNTAIDFSGHNNNGTFGGTVRRVEGFVGGGIELSGGYVAVDGVVDDIKSTNITLSAWIKTTQAGEGNLFAANDASSGYALLFGVKGGNPYRWDTADAQYPPAVNDNEWHLLTYVRDGGTGYIYVDGVQRASYSSSFSLTNITRWSIGQEWDGSTASDFYYGLVDDARIYNKALTPDEVKELMRGDPLLAWKPSPDDGSTMDVIRAGQGLSWSAGDDAKQHDVYFGTDKAAVDAAQASDTTGIYRGRQAKASYTPTETLAWGTGPYYWRIDEINSDGTITTGAVWSFSVADFLIVEDFESYTDNEGSRIYEAWIDGWTNNTGSVVGNLTAPFAEQTIVHGGSQSMPMDYNNTRTPFYSEAEYTFAAQQNWTTYGVNTLSLWVRGNPIRFADKGNGAFTVGASGHDIWDNADDFRFVYKRLNGDGSVTVKVDSLVNTHAWAKAGVMIRESLDASSPMAYMIQSFSSGVSFGWRQLPGATCGSQTQTGIVAPQWVRLTRKGNVFTAQYSANGTTWTDIKDANGQIVQTVVNMAANLYVGLCVTSHNTAATTVAEFSGAATTGSVTGQWQQVWIGDDPDRTNGPDSLYVAVEDSTGKVAVKSDAMLVNAAAWTEWAIPLSDFTGVNMARVKTLYIGVGNRANPAPGGSGRVYIDDIRLAKPAPAQP